MILRDLVNSAREWALHFTACLFMGLGFVTQAWGEYNHTVSPTEKLNNIATAILNNATPGLHHISFTQYSDVGTFTIPQGRVLAADTVLFTQDKNNPGILRLNSNTPLLEVFGCIKPLIFQGMSIQLRHPQATLSAQSITANPNGNLVFRDCIIFADSLGSGTLLNWASAPNYGVTFERCFLVAKTTAGVSKLVINAGNLKITNCNFNLSALFEATINGKLDIQNNTFNRIQFKINSDIQDAGSTIANNLFAFRGGLNQTGTTSYYPLYFGEKFDLQPLGLNTNKWFSTWDSLYRTISQTERFDDAGIKILPVTDRDTSELWNWYLPDSSVGFFSGPQRGNAFNVFPGTRSKRALLYQDSTLVTFDSSPVPRRFLPSPKAGVPAANQFPYLRFAWAEKGGYAFDGFIIDSLKMLSGQANHGGPVLVYRKAESDSFFQQSNSSTLTTSPRWFANSMNSVAKIFYPAYLCLLPMGETVSVPKPTTIDRDDIVFRKIDSAGNFFYYATDDTYNVSRNDTRFLGISRSYNTSAKTTDSLLVVIHQKIPSLPFLSDSVYWHALRYKSEPLIRGLRLNDSTFQFVAPPMPVDTVIQFFLVEKLSVPKGQQTLSGSGYSITTQTKNGFQMSVDTIPKPNPEAFDQLSAALSLRIFGRSREDTVIITLDSKGSNTAYWQRGGIIDSLPRVSPEIAGKVKIILPVASDSGMLFLGRKLNIIKSTIFAGQVNGIAISQFFSPTSGMLSVKILSESELGADPILQDVAFLKGWTFKAENISANGFQMVDTLPFPVDTSRVKVLARPAGSEKWSRFPARFSQLNGGTITVSGLAILEPYLDLIAIQDLSPLNSLPLVKSKASSTNVREFDFTFTPAAAPLSATHYKIEIRAIDPLGVQFTYSTPIVPLGLTASLSISNNQLAIYRIRVYQGNQLIATRGDNLVGLFDVKHIDSLAAQDSLSWHLLAAPYTQSPAGLADIAWLNFFDPLSPGKRDSVTRLEITNSAGQEAFRQVGKPLNLKTGDGILLATARRFRARWTDAQVPPLTVFQVSAIKPLGGWQFVSHPFPFPLHPSQITSTRGITPTFRQLSRIGKNEYSWVSSPSMSPHEGYVYYFQSGEILTFDPLKSVALPKQAAGESISEFILDFPGGRKQVELIPGGQATDNIPWLPSPGQGLDLRLGSRRGYLRLAISEDRRIRLPLALYSPKPKNIRWNLTALPKFMAAALLDTLTGKAIRPGEDSLRLQSGWNEFQLLAAGESDLQSELAHWQERSAKPFSMQWPSVLRRNEPWSLRFNWNQALAENGQTLRLTLMTLDGKSVFDQHRRPSHIGEQEWVMNPVNGSGTLIMRLQVEGKAPISWQQKVMVMP